MSRPAYLGRCATKMVVREHIKFAENCHKDPDELSDFVDQLYGAAGPGPWDLVDIGVDDMIALCSRLGTFRIMGRRESDKTARYVEKILRSQPPPGAIAYNPDLIDDEEVLAGLSANGFAPDQARELAGWHVIDGRHRLLALKQAGRDRSRWYVPTKFRLKLHSALAIIDGSNEISDQPLVEETA